MTEGLNEWLNDWRTERLTECITEWMTKWLTERLTEQKRNWMNKWMIAYLTDQTEWMNEWLIKLHNITAMSLQSHLHDLASCSYTICWLELVDSITPSRVTKSLSGFPSKFPNSPCSAGLLFRASGTRICISSWWTPNSNSHRIPASEKQSCNGIARLHAWMAGRHLRTYTRAHLYTHTSTHQGWTEYQILLSTEYLRLLLTSTEYRYRVFDKV